MKLSLVSCRSPFLDDDRIYPPLGLLYLKSAIAAQVPDAEISIIDDYDLDGLDQFGTSDAIGISIMTPQREEAQRLATAIRYRWPEKTLIAGGPHVRHYEASMDQSWQPWDYLVGGDGERALPAIVRGEPVSRALLHDQIPRQALAAMPRPDRLGEAAFLRNYSYTLAGLNGVQIL
jgi:anaerobic magnesium-protoporphyrin IX monomethyl ester cyclase